MAGKFMLAWVNPGKPRVGIDMKPLLAVAGEDFDQVKWPEHTLTDVFRAYMREALMRKGKEHRRPFGTMLLVCDFFPPNIDPAKMAHEHIEALTDFLLDECELHPNSVRRVLGVLRAALIHAENRRRIAKAPHIEVPEYVEANRRPLMPDEYRLVRSKYMSRRLRRFYTVEFYTGARPRAVEELRWPWGVDFENAVLNFNPPGRRITPNKRRPDAFPIDPKFLELLRQWKDQAPPGDDYVIGLGPRGRCTTTFHEASHVVRVLCGLTDPTLVPRHCMRKMFVSDLVEKMIERDGTADLETVGKLVCDNPEILRRHYLKTRDERLRAMASLRATA